jgi:hypothetical protein
VGLDEGEHRVERDPQEPGGTLHLAQEKSALQGGQQARARSSGRAEAVSSPESCIERRPLRRASVQRWKLASMSTRVSGSVSASWLPRDPMRRYEFELPFTVVADPGKDLYRTLGVESSPRAIFNPRFWLRVPAVVAQVARTVRRSHRAAPLRPRGGQLGLPADFLFDSRGRVVAVKYGLHASDQWSVDQLLEHAASTRGRSASEQT